MHDNEFLKLNFTIAPIAIKTPYLHFGQNQNVLGQQQNKFWVRARAFLSGPIPLFVAVCNDDGWGCEWSGGSDGGDWKRDSDPSEQQHSALQTTVTSSHDIQKNMGRG